MVSYLMMWWDIAVERLRDSLKRRERGSVTIENVVWALAVIVIAGVVVTIIVSFVKSQSNALAIDKNDWGG